uniref:Uncharacterized protein n=1 Tax=Oryza barthii TaxID=65489 RepID=A0A0D3GLQ0_9ORYZ
MAERLHLPPLSQEPGNNPPPTSRMQIHEKNLDGTSGEEGNPRQRPKEVMTPEDVAAAGPFIFY